MCISSRNCRPSSTRIASGWPSFLALIALSVGLVGIYADTMIESGCGYNLLNNPVLEADILIRISAKGVVRNQIRSIGVYPYAGTA